MRFVSLCKTDLKQSKLAWMKEGTTVSWKGIAQSGKRNSVGVCKTMMYYPMSQKTFSQVLYDQSFADPHTHKHLPFTQPNYQRFPGRRTQTVEMYVAVPPLALREQSTWVSPLLPFRQISHMVLFTIFKGLVYRKHLKHTIT